MSRAALAAVTVDGDSVPRWATIEAFIDACAAYAEARKRPLPAHEVDMLVWKTRYDQAYPGQRKDRSPSGPPKLTVVGMVPGLGDCFQPRALVDELAHATDDGGTAVLTGTTRTGTQLLSGLGGVGKTQLAVHLAHHLRDTGQMDLLVWISATSRPAVTAGYAQTAIDLALPGADGTDTARDAARFHAWLATTDRRWLVVLDDLTTSADMKGLWPPIRPTGRTVVTTRLRGSTLSGPGRRLVPVGVFTSAEAAAYLRARLDDHPDLADDIDGLAAALHHLPLALSHATAYMIDEDLSCAEYKRRLYGRRHRLDDLAPSIDDLPDDYTRTVAATVSLSVQAADRIRPTCLATPLLQLASVLDPAGFPASIFATTAARNWLSYARTTASAPGAEEKTDLGEPDLDAIRSGLRCLHRLNLITINADTVAVHGLVQRAIRDQLNDDNLAECAWAAADAVLELWPEPERDVLLAQRLRASTAAVYRHSNDGLFAFEPHPALFRSNDSLYTFGETAAAATAYDELLADCQRILGPDHPDTLKARCYLAHCWGSVDPARAAQAIDQLLPDCLRILGPDHTNTLGARNLLAYWRGSAGDPAGAAHTLEQLVTEFVRVLGPEHPDTLTTRSNLAEWRGRAGDPAGAEVLCERLLIDRARVLGAEHPDTLLTQSQLARWRGEAGNPGDAVALYEQVLTSRVRILGPDHPHTLTTRSDLANWRGKAGDAAGAVALHEELLADCLRALGSDHPDTLATRSDLVHWQGEAGDPDGALALHEGLIADFLRVLGPGHPRTLTIRSNLGHWRGKAGDPASAVAIYEDVLADALSLLGPDHGDTLAVRGRLARWRGEAGDPAGAVTAFQQLLDDYLRVLGPDHARTLTTRSDLAHWRKRADDNHDTQ